MRTINLQSVVWKEDDYYISQCLDVDVSSFGKTEKQALDNLQDALELYYEDVPVPQKGKVKNPMIASIPLQYD